MVYRPVSHPGLGLKSLSLNLGVTDCCVTSGQFLTLPELHPNAGVQGWEHTRLPGEKRPLGWELSSTLQLRRGASVLGSHTESELCPFFLTRRT